MMQIMVLLANSIAKQQEIVDHPSYMIRCRIEIFRNMK